MIDKNVKSFEELAEPYISSPEVQKMKDYIQHGKTTTLDHCENVARMSLHISRRFRINSDENALVKSAILHDYYLYDWHNDDHPRFHGFHHPATAARNAKAAFGLSKKEENIIQSHMWPLTITKIPASREAAIVCIADKVCAIKEMFKKY